MNIGIDFDNTLYHYDNFERMALMWGNALKPIAEDGHKIFIVTRRDLIEERWNSLNTTQVGPLMDLVEETAGIPIFTGVIFAGEYRRKTLACRQMKVPIHLWIDDDPSFI